MVKDPEFAALKRHILRGGASGFKPADKLTGTVIDTLGAIPTSDGEKLTLINKSTRTPLALDDVHLFLVEACNNLYLPDRYGFLGSGTVQGAATAADEGIAFLNGHRWDLLPLGKTYAGQYEQVISDQGKIRERALMGIYLPKDFRPNGDSEPGTNDIARGVETGVIFDVSVGYVAGPESIVRCNVCGQPYWGTCRHWRGSNDGMTLDEQIYARDVLGVPGGVCTVTFDNFRVNEVSAVYDGAAQGAGFLAPASVG
jgi:hypothetical protein